MKVTPLSRYAFCHCQDIKNRYSLYAALMLYQ
jgi:hypothetical protein